MKWSQTLNSPKYCPTFNSLVFSKASNYKWFECFIYKWFEHFPEQDCNLTCTFRKSLTHFSAINLSKFCWVFLNKNPHVKLKLCSVYIMLSLDVTNHFTVIPSICIASSTPHSMDFNQVPAQAIRYFTPGWRVWGKLDTAKRIQFLI